MFVSLQFKLELKREDKEKLIRLMRKQSSAIRIAYNMLKELEKEKTRNPHAQIYHRLRQLFPDLSTKYIDSAIYKAKQYPTDKPVGFGSKRLFEKLKITPPGKGGEIQLTDAIKLLLEEEVVYALKIDAKVYDTGTPLGYLTTLVEFALNRKDIRDDFLKFLEDVVNRYIQQTGKA